MSDRDGDCESARERPWTLGAQRLWTLGAQRLDAQRVAFNVWAPTRERVELVFEADARCVGLTRAENGYWHAVLEGVENGARYRYRLDGETQLLPDPCSRFQPDGPHGPSQFVDASEYAWRDQAWQGIEPDRHVIYELHLGTFTPEGTWRAALARLPHLRSVGITTLELMPVSEFPGGFGWGYDGVDFFAPFHGYGSPDAFREFVDEAHSLGLAVILDVVYNHLGPDGNYLQRYSPFYFSKRDTEWGAALNFDGEHCHGTRTFVLENAAYWIRDFHLDGLRLDATQSIFDTSATHILSALSERVRGTAGSRHTFLVAENEPQETRLVGAREDGGYGLDALWNDDLHHSAVAALTGRHPAYYSETLGNPQELISAVKRGYLYQGQRYAWQKKARGSSSQGLPYHAFVAFLENHDQVANSSTGQRLWQLTSPGRYRAMTALLLLAPWTPMLFQGQEWCSERPFFYFADHAPELAQLVRAGRSDFLKQFPNCQSDQVQQELRDPAAEETYARSKLDWTEPEASPRARQALQLHRDLLRLRRDDAVLGKRRRGLQVDGAVLGAESFALRFFDVEGEDRLLLLNLGRDQRLVPAPEPLLAPSAGRAWRLAWSSEELRYGGIGTPPIDPAHHGFHLTGHSALLLTLENDDGARR